MRYEEVILTASMLSLVIKTVKLKRILTILALLLSLSAYGQVENDTIQVLAVRASPGQGSKVHMAEFKVLKLLKGPTDLYLPKLVVGYHVSDDLTELPDTAIMTLIPYPGDSILRGYYIFPDYDAVKWSAKASVSYVYSNYWEGCETGTGNCDPLTFIRPEGNVRWFILMPCGGTTTWVSLHNATDMIGSDQVGVLNCPPGFDVTNLPDGEYSAHMVACGLGGPIRFYLKSKP